MSGATRGDAAFRARVTGGFWKERIDTVATRAIEAQWRAINDEIPGAEPSHAVENFRIAAGESDGAYLGTVWQDSDVAKWLEAASNCLHVGANPPLEARVDEVIRLVGKAQGPDGYLNTYFTLVAPEKRWVDLAWGHELYCAGHLIEAAVSHNAATGKTTLLGVATRLADCIDRAFGPEEGKNHGCCGHPEIELALFRLHGATGEGRYARLARHFLEIRGREPERFRDQVPLGFTIPKTKWFAPDYFQAHKPLRRERDAVGHAVRAMYLYSAMADECRLTGDAELLETLRGLWESVTFRRMYITGGIGSQAHGERFTIDWDLPPDTVYAETCASIGLALWAQRMLLIDRDGRYADIVERAVFNGILSGMSRDGSRYFYVNPLETVPALCEAREDHSHVLPARVEWFGCSCCPPNIARLVASLDSRLFGIEGRTILVHQYAECEASFDLGRAAVALTMATDYPWDGKVSLVVTEARGEDFALALRVPGWCHSVSWRLNGKPIESPRVERGYASFEGPWRAGDRLELEFAMPPVLMRADSRVRELAGKVAVQRGPLVYCAEERDNGAGLHELSIGRGAGLSIEAGRGELEGIVTILARGWREDGQASGVPEGLYLPCAPEPEGASSTLRLVPYHVWGNRGKTGEMAVWLRAR